MFTEKAVWCMPYSFLGECIWTMTDTRFERVEAIHMFRLSAYRFTIDGYIGVGYLLNVANLTGCICDVGKRAIAQINRTDLIAGQSLQVQYNWSFADNDIVQVERPTEIRWEMTGLTVVGHSDEDCRRMQIGAVEGVDIDVSGEATTQGV